MMRCQRHLCEVHLRILTVSLCAVRSRIVTVATLATASAFQIGMPMGVRTPVVCRSAELQMADIVDTAVGAGSFKTLAAALGAAGLVDTMKSPGPFTVFAPTDAAFAKLPAGTVEELIKPENKAKLTGILTYHVVSGKVMASTVVTMDGKKVPTVNGAEVTIKVGKDGVMVDAAMVTTTDIECDNGVIHVIDSVIMPSEKKAGKKGKENKTPLEDLVVGAEVVGKIKSVMSYGAFVDIGASTDGLLHVSEISNEFIKDATEKLTAGDSITCKVKAVNLEKKQLALTCKEPQAPRAPRAAGGGERKPKADLAEFETADPKVFITGKVNSITEFGAFITIKEGVDGLVHISQIQDGGVKSVGDVLTVGQEVQVRVTNVDKAKRRIGLSMRPWVEQAEKSSKGGESGEEGGRSGGFSGEGWMYASDGVTAEELASMNAGDEFTSPFDFAMARSAAVASKKAKKEKYVVGLSA